jgi:hypothetical protein
VLFCSMSSSALNFEQAFYCGVREIHFHVIDIRIFDAVPYILNKRRKERHLV